MRRGLKIWSAMSVLLVAVMAERAISMPPGYPLRTLGDLVQTTLLVALTAVLVMNARNTHGNLRFFWFSMSLGSALWFTATLMWTIYEVILRKPVPVPFIADVLFFIHIVPFMAALSLRPHRRLTGTENVFGPLDFAMLLVWWMYLYGYVVLPWHWARLDTAKYGFNFTLLYEIENAAFVIGLASLCVLAKGAWRRLYLNLLAASGIYVIGSQLVNRAIDRGVYYTGSIFDIPLIAAMCWFIYAAADGGAAQLLPQAGGSARAQNVVMSRLAMATVISIPVLAFLGVFIGKIPHQVAMYRIYVTMAAMVVMPLFVFVKQQMMTRELVRLLGLTKKNLDNQKRLQVQLVQAEKLTSIAQFVSGAAHQINNPLTAVIGYTDLLGQEPLTPDQQSWVAKLGQQARRTAELVNDLRKFARQAPTEKFPCDVNSIVRDAIELAELDLRGQVGKPVIEIVRELDPALPRALADPNQILQVCFQIIRNALDAMQASGGTLSVRSTTANGMAALEFSDNGPGITDPKMIFDPFFTTKKPAQATGLGLSVSYGIVRAHKGDITCQNRPEGGATFTVTLPLATEDVTAIAASSTASAR